MAVITIGNNSVSVASYDDLNTVLSDAGGAYSDWVANVYLAADIQMQEGGISISPAYRALTLDGTDPATAQVHRITDWDSNDDDDTIHVDDDEAVMEITFQNLNWTGYNYYGICYLPDDGWSANVRLSLLNIDYDGVQLIYHRLGYVRIQDCSIVIEENEGSDNPHEVGEMNTLEIGGTTSIQHTDPNISSEPAFHFYGDTPSMRILPDANVQLSTIQSVVDPEDDRLSFTVDVNAQLRVQTALGMCHSQSHSFTDVTIAPGALFEMVQTQAEEDDASIFVSGTFSVGVGASVMIQTQTEESNPLLAFQDDAQLSLNDPRSFVVYNATAAALLFDDSTNFSILGGQVNHWRAATEFPEAGGMTDIPDDSWRKSDGTLTTMAGSAQGETQITSTNLTADELTDKQLTNLNLAAEQVFSVGDLPLTLDVMTTQDTSITGQTAPQATVALQIGGAAQPPVTADDTGAFTFPDVGALPENTIVTATANLPFLLTTAEAQVVSPGEILIDAPDTIPFTLSPVAQTPVVLYGRAESGWTLVVRDTRVNRTAWRLMATATEPLTLITSRTDLSHSLPDMLVYVDETGGVEAFAQDPIAVFDGPADGGVDEDGDGKVDTDVSWDADRGILLQDVGIAVYANQLYSTPIAWSLADA